MEVRCIVLQCIVYRESNNVSIEFHVIADGSNGYVGCQIEWKFSLLASSFAISKLPDMISFLKRLVKSFDFNCVL